jgi:YgiT-type zinc finger domain-containing protein
MMMKQTKERCAVCGKPGVIHRRLTKALGRGASILVVENVPVVACPHCGESYITAETGHEIERLKLHRRSLAKKRSVATVSFA